MISIEAIFAIGGLAMVGVGLLGGLEFEKLKIQQLPNWIRAIAIITGIVLLTLSVSISPNPLFTHRADFLSTEEAFYSIQTAQANIPTPAPILQTVVVTQPSSAEAKQGTSTFSADVPIAISAQKGWQKTDVQISIGDKVDIAVIDGEWTACRKLLSSSEKDLLNDDYKDHEVYVNCARETSGDGSSVTCVENKLNDCPLPDSRMGRLIARIGLNNPFEISEHSTFVSTYSGVLELRMNTSDAALKSSFGMLAVIIKVEKP